MTPPHTIRSGYYYNYILDSSHLYWAARWLELHKPLDEREIALNNLMVSRLRNAADTVMQQGIEGMKLPDKITPAEEMEMAETLRLSNPKEK